MILIRSLTRSLLLPFICAVAISTAVPALRAEIPPDQIKAAGAIPLTTELLDKMDKREATVLRMRFGLDDEEPKTLKEIGECLGLTRERVRQIESEALSKLSESMQSD